MPKVVPIPHEFGRFEVEASDPDQPPYLVDCLDIDEDGNGACGCRDFEITVKKARKTGDGPKFCKHQMKERPKSSDEIAGAFAYFGWLCARRMVKEAKERKKAKRK